MDKAQNEGYIKDIDKNLFKLVYVSAVETMLLGYNMTSELSFSQMQNNMVGKKVELKKNKRCFAP